MDRLMVLQLTTQGCEAEAWFNGVPLGRCGPQAATLRLPVHEFARAGDNRLELVLGPRPAVETRLPPPPEPQWAEQACFAHLVLLLPRIGKAADPAEARTLAQLDWTQPEGGAWLAPHRLATEVTLPINFPRWRHMDAPVIERSPATQSLVFAFLQRLVFDLHRGQFEGLAQATRLRSEELALAYPREPAPEPQRLCRALEALHALRPLKWSVPDPKGLALRPVAEGRLLECLGEDGQPLLRSEPDAHGMCHSLPLRVALVEGKIYVLR